MTDDLWQPIAMVVLVAFVVESVHLLRERYREVRDQVDEMRPVHADLVHRDPKPGNLPRARALAAPVYVAERPARCRTCGGRIRASLVARGPVMDPRLCPSCGLVPPTSMPGPPEPRLG